MCEYRVPISSVLIIELFLFVNLQAKADKWAKMIGSEENVMLVNEFLEKGDCRVLLITLTQAGALQPAVTFPSSLKAKGVYFVKK